MVHMDYRVSGNRIAMLVEAARRQAATKPMRAVTGAGRPKLLSRWACGLLSRVGSMLIIAGHWLRRLGPAGPWTLEGARALGRR
jgi:hypothetical protein